jgi:hypothetical protein
MVVLSAALSVCGGCIDRLVQATMAPQAAVAENLTKVGNAAASGANNNQAAIRDIDRILERNPDVPNRGELVAMRNQLAGTRAAGSVPTSDFHARALSRRDTPLDRSLPKRRPDRPRLLPKAGGDTTGITQPLTPMVATGQVPQIRNRTWITSDVSPVRVR